MSSFTVSRLDRNNPLNMHGQAYPFQNAQLADALVQMARLGLGKIPRRRRRRCCRTLVWRQMTVKVATNVAFIVGGAGFGSGQVSLGSGSWSMPLFLSEVRETCEVRQRLCCFDFVCSQFHLRLSTFFR